MVDLATIFIIIAIGYLILVSYAIVIIFRAISFYLDKQKFNKTLFAGLKTNAIETLDDIINLYANIRHLNPEDIRYRYGLSKWLRDFWIILISKEEKSIEDTKIRDFKLKIDGFILQVEKSSPFSDVPNKERSILTNYIF